jgi:hypothetical protein
MKELIGKCSLCSKELFCLEGFFNGVILENKELVCFECVESDKEV